MKKTTITKKSKYINIACIIAIVFAMYCQFISGWQFSGTVVDGNTNEKRADMEMEMSVAKFTWNPSDTDATQDSTAFKNYIKDPTLKITETILVNKNGSLSTEQCDAIGLIAGYKETKDKFDIKKKIDIAAATLETEDAATYPFVFDPTYDREKVLAELEAENADQETEGTASDTETTEEPVKEESAPSTDVVENKNILVAITTSHIDPIAKGQTTLLANSKDKEAALNSYNEYADYLSSLEDSSIFINGLIKFPTILLILEFLAIILIVFRMLKGKGTLLSSILAFLAGLFSLIYFYTEPILLLFQADSFDTVDMILSVVTVVGFGLAMYSINFDMLRKGLLKFTKNSVFTLLFLGIVTSIIGLLASKVFFVGATTGFSSLSLTLGIISLVLGAFGFFKAVIAAYKDKRLVERASK